MPRFFFHLVRDDRILEDEDGSEMDGLAEARSEAATIIRELASEHVLAGRPFLFRSVRIANEEGVVLDEISCERILREIFFHKPSECPSDACR